jgi:hypothetical protein
MARELGNRQINFPLRLSEDEKKELEQTAKLTGIPQNTIAADGVAMRCKQLREMFSGKEKG